VVGGPVVPLDASFRHLHDFVRYFSFFTGHKANLCHGGIVAPQSLAKRRTYVSRLVAMPAALIVGLVLLVIWLSRRRRAR
jgi:sensor c-di-GMP phosphodiesterase-like protein